MNNDSPPGSSRPPVPGRGEFTWPPTSAELDAIEVIKLDDTSSTRQVAAIPKAIVAAPLIKRRRWQWDRLRRDDLVLAGVTMASVLAIAAAAIMQFSDAPRTFVEPSDASIVPMAATAPLTAASLPVASELTAAATPMATASAPPATDAPAPIATIHKLDNGAPATPRPRTAARAATPRGKAAHARTRAQARGHAPRVAEQRRVTPVAASYTRPVERSSVDYSQPRLISPEQARKGKLVLWVEVRKNGKVGDVDVLSSDLDRKNRSHRDLQRAAISTVKRWRYSPAIRDGAPEESHVRVVVDINLDSAGVAFTEAGARRTAAAANRVADSVLAAR